MKKVTRILSLLVVLGMCLSLCGCQALDDLRAARASFTAEGVIRFFDGTEYKLLPECEELCPDFRLGEDIYIVEEELPLLLTVFGDSSVKSADGRFLRITTYSEEYEHSFKTQYYCRSDIYDSMLARIQNGFVPDVYAYTYYDYELDASVLYELTPAQVDAVNQVYTTQEPEILPAGAKLYPEHSVFLYLYSSDYLFRRETVDICLVEEKYFLVVDDHVLYSVPEELFPIFAEIMAKETELYSEQYD